MVERSSEGACSKREQYEGRMSWQHIRTCNDEVPHIKDELKKRGEMVVAFDTENNMYTVSEAIEHFGFGKFQIKVSIVGGLLCIGDGLELATITLLGQYLQCEWRLNNFQVMMLATVTFFGTCIGSIVTGKLLDLYGRKRIIVIFTAFLLYFSIISAFSSNFITMLLTRFCLGFFLSSYFHSFSLVMEFLPKDYRAYFGCIAMCPFALSFTLEYLLAGLTVSSLGWRVWLLISASPYIVILCGTLIIPESVRFLNVQGEKEKLMATLNCISRDNGIELPKGQLILENSYKRGQLKDLFRKPYLSIFLPACVVSICSVCTYSSPQLLLPVLKNSENESEIICSLSCLDKGFSFYLNLMKATILEILSVPIMAVSLTFSGRRTALSACSIMTALLLIPIFFTSFMNFIFLGASKMFSSTVVTLFHIYQVELFPTQIRGIAVGSLTTTYKLSSILSSVIVVLYLSYPRVAILFIFTSSLLIPFVGIYLPETKNKYLSDKLEK
ncbi:Synaptic vesicle 2-related protein [Nymphon striatum]|nr:Synaptic vesicle 2-related protein [Nymphon striatum]